MRSQSHWSVTHQRFYSLNWYHESWSNEHDQDEQTQELIFIHKPQKHRKKLEESKRVNKLISEDAAERSDRNLKYIIIVELFVLSLPKSFNNDVGNRISLNFRLKSFEISWFLAEIKFPLLESENIENLTAFQLLTVEISDSIDSFLSLPLLYYIDVAGILKIWLFWTPKSSVLNERLQFFRPVTHDIRQR